MKKYSYITGAMLSRLDSMSHVKSNNFAMEFVLINLFGLSKIQAGRVIKYWRQNPPNKAINTDLTTAPNSEGREPAK